RTYNQILSLCGIGLIFLAIITYTEDTIFPGASALLPCLGSVMIIWAGMGGKSTYVSQFLCLRPIVFVGLISYSLYLWHWPILAFIRQLRSQTILPLLDVGAVLVLSFLLAVMSWRYVEQPFRQSSFLSRQRIFTLSIVASFVFMGVGFATYMMNGWPHRLSPELQRIAMGAEDVDQKRLSCNRRTPEDGLCTAGPAEAPSSVLLWGDSHAGAMVPALQHIVSTQQEKLTYATHEACLPLTGVQRAGQGKSCARFNEAVLTWLETGDHGIQKVVLLGRWALSATGERLPGEAGAAVRLETIGDTLSSPSTVHDNPALLEMGLAATLERLDKIGMEVVLLGGVPEREQNVPRTLFHQTRFPLPKPSLSLQDVQKRHGVSHAILTNLSKEDHVQYIPLDHFICTPDCLMVHDGYPLYYDDNHLSVYGAAELFGPKLVPYFRPSYMTLVSASK
ncbi:MAG: acyltransferase family protein, partial [Pseudomonadota bacterium]